MRILPVQLNKGRDLYDVWFLLNAGVKIAGELVEKKSGRQNISAEIKTMEFVSKREYERDMKRLTSRVIPYEQVMKEIKSALDVSLFHVHKPEPQRIQLPESGVYSEFKNIPLPAA